MNFKLFISINLLMVLLILLLGCFKGEHKIPTTNYLIPSDYEGAILFLYGAPGQKKLEENVIRRSIPIEIRELEALKYMNIGVENYGLFITSSLENASKKFYYLVDSNGKKKKLNSDCIYSGGHGKFIGASDITIHYRILEISQSQCGKDFWMNGDYDYHIQAGKAKAFWMNFYDEYPKN